MTPRTFTKKEVAIVAITTALVSMLVGYGLIALISGFVADYSQSKAQYGYEVCVADLISGIEQYGYIQVLMGDETVTLIPITQETNEETTDLN